MKILNATSAWLCRLRRSCSGRAVGHWFRKLMVSNLRTCYEMEIDGWGLLLGPWCILLRLSYALSPKRYRQLSKRALLSRGYKTGESQNTHIHPLWSEEPIPVKDIRAAIQGEGMLILDALCRSLGCATAHTEAPQRTTTQPTKAGGSI